MRIELPGHGELPGPKIKPPAIRQARIPAARIGRSRNCSPKIGENPSEDLAASKRTPSCLPRADAPGRRVRDPSWSCVKVTQLQASAVQAQAAGRKQAWGIPEELPDAWMSRIGRDGSGYSSTKSATESKLRRGFGVVWRRCASGGGTCASRYEQYAQPVPQKKKKKKTTSHRRIAATSTTTTGSASEPLTANCALADPASDAPDSPMKRPARVKSNPAVPAHRPDEAHVREEIHRAAQRQPSLGGLDAQLRHREHRPVESQATGERFPRVALGRMPCPPRRAGR